MPDRPPILALLLLLFVPSCSSRGPKPIVLGSECAACGMSIGDSRFACERQSDGWLQYDSIECMLADPKRGDVWLADYDSQTLAPAESVWVVQGDFASPMGGGLAAFRSRVAAERVAAETHGKLVRWSELSRKTP